MVSFSPIVKSLPKNIAGYLDRKSDQHWQLLSGDFSTKHKHIPSSGEYCTPTPPQLQELGSIWCLGGDQRKEHEDGSMWSLPNGATPLPITSQNGAGTCLQQKAKRNRSLRRAQVVFYVSFTPFICQRALITQRSVAERKSVRELLSHTDETGRRECRRVPHHGLNFPDPNPWGSPGLYCLCPVRGASGPL